MSNQCVVARHINGVVLNEFEFLLDSSGNPIVFSNREAAVNMLKGNGYTDEEVESCYFFSYEKLNENVYKEVEIESAMAH